MKRQEQTLFPTFTYHPDPLATGMIQQKPTICPVCQQFRAYVYVGPFYAKEQVKGLCPWCIADGSAAATYQGTFQDAASCEEAAPEHLNELEPIRITQQREKQSIRRQNGERRDNSLAFCPIE